MAEYIPMYVSGEESKENKILIINKKSLSW